MFFCFAPKYNLRGKKDATGAFQPEAQAFCRLHQRSTIALFDNTAPTRERLMEVVKWFGEITPGSLDAIVAFCHGHKAGLQCGVTIANADTFATALERVCSPRPRIVLYACDAARDADTDRFDDVQTGPGGEGGFADKLRHALVGRGVQATIYAHSTAGHTTHNPYVRRFGPSELAGGRWVIEPRSALWCAWVKALRGSMRLRFPFLTQREIEAELVQRIA